MTPPEIQSLMAKAITMDITKTIIIALKTWCMMILIKEIPPSSPKLFGPYLSNNSFAVCESKPLSNEV
ncbi:unnamed protein product [[Candida] boidinii]|nr:unnamed protein product [[Candida] boidinii]